MFLSLSSLWIYLHFGQRVSICYFCRQLERADKSNRFQLCLQVICKSFCNVRQNSMQKPGVFMKETDITDKTQKWFSIFPCSYISNTFPIHFQYISNTFPIHFQYISNTFPIHFQYISYIGFFCTRFIPKLVLYGSPGNRPWSCGLMLLMEVPSLIVKWEVCSNWERMKPRVYGRFMVCNIIHSGSNGDMLGI